MKTSGIAGVVLQDAVMQWAALPNQPAWAEHLLRRPAIT
jgi:hypothetical protein